ncbi:S9 family peptidase [Undibacterium sp. TS12]|uniref:alpha/beta hydrolase family protein n=1 Tax=Undibacterium sp. TS12 TaxID=2908202 RepID=UPI001F4D0E0D|nr:S9 family peptidase [Undibacterium sp. TS12]MCH8622868.1 S9 family peptidase [Undibacterium sp. TS12]
MKTRFLNNLYPMTASCLALCLSMAGCGGGGSSNNGPGPVTAPEVSNPPGAGHFEAATFIKTISASDVAAALPKDVASGVTPLYAVDAYKITYTTTDSASRSVTASGLALIPRKSASVVSPVLAYQHATIKTDAEAPSNHATPDEPAVLFAAMGYIVSAADYVGYGSTKGMPHPYLLAAPTANSVVDFMTATSRWRQTRSIADNGQLFMTGYSEGAYATAATLRLMTQNKAALPVVTYVGAGPYDVTLTLNAMLSAVRQQNPIVGALISPGFLKNLGANDRANVRNLLLSSALGSQSDISFDPAFLDNFLNDDTAAIAAQSNVYDWTPQSAISFFHGRDDTTVPYGNTDSIFNAMSKRGAGSLIDRTDCTVKPAEHIPCVPSFLVNDIKRMGALAKGL